MPDFYTYKVQPAILEMTLSYLIPLIIIVAIATIAFLVNYFSKKNVIIRTLTKIPKSTIGSLRINHLVKITGKALHVKEPLIAPYSKRKCIFYSIEIEQRVKSGKSSSWRTLVKDEKFQEFFLNVNGEYVIVKPVSSPQNYICYLVVDSKQRSGVFNGPTSEFKEVLDRYNVKTENFFGFNKNLRYSEGIIEIGEQITVAGIAKWKPLNQPIPEYPYSKIAALVSDDKQKIILTDLPEVTVPKLK